MPTLRQALGLPSTVTTTELDATANTYTQTYSTAARTVPAAPALPPPAGGTGATAGAYDTAVNRDAMITALTATQADLLALKQVVNGVIDDLQALRLVG